MKWKSTATPPRRNYFKQRDLFGEFEFAGEIQRRLALLIAHGFIGARREQNARHLRVERHHQRRLSFDIAPIEVRSRLDQNLSASGIRDLVQRGIGVDIVLRVHIRSRLNEQARHLCRIFTGPADGALPQRIERGAARRIALIDVGMMLQQFLHYPRIGGRRRSLQRRKVLGKIRVAAGFEQGTNLDDIADLGCMHQFGFERCLRVNRHRHRRHQHHPRHERSLPPS